MFSRISLDRLLNKIDRRSVSKDGKIEAVHGVLKQQQTLCLLVGDLISRKVWWKVSQVSGRNGDLSRMRFAAERRTHQPYL